jgi:hypothetical protein
MTTGATTRRFNLGPWIVLAALAAGGALVWFYYPRPQPVVASAPAPAPAPGVAAPAVDAPLQPQDTYPVEQIPVLPEAAQVPLPPLADSDGAFLDAASAAFGGDAGRWLVGEFVVPRLVATIDNLPRRTLTRPVYAARPLAGELGVAEADGKLWLDAGNSARYDAAVAAFEQVDARRAVSLYVQWYPLFEAAYRDLGEPGTTFNDRLVAVIDHLLAAPDVAGPIELRRADSGRPRLLFADPAREEASVGHKAMWRLGPDHAARVKAKLRELRALLAGQRPAA